MLLKKALVIICLSLSVLGCSDDNENDAKKHGVFDVYLQPIDKAELELQHQQAQQNAEKQKRHTEERQTHQ